jgi:hypothetical protein
MWTTVVFAVHIAAGAIALVAGTLAGFARKGGRLHRGAGNLFFVSMLVMAAGAGYLAVVMPGQIGNLFGAVFAAYLVTTGWLTVRRNAGVMPERIALVAALLLLAPFVILLLQATTHSAFLFKSAMAPHGPVLIATYCVTAVLAIAALGDAKVAFAGGISGAARIARHLWRMCLGLTIAVGSAFTNGFARALPGPYHVPGMFFLPLLVPLGLLVFWMIRVRLTGWYRNVGQGRLTLQLATP